MGRYCPNRDQLNRSEITGRRHTTLSFSAGLSLSAVSTGFASRRVLNRDGKRFAASAISVSVALFGDRPVSHLNSGGIA